MKVQVIGTRKMDFATDKGQVTGIKLYLVGRNPEVVGQITDTLWITSTSPLYAFACSLNPAKGAIDVELIYEQFVGVKKPVLTELKVS